MSVLDRDKALEKLRKLKALAEDRAGNLNETATAAALMTRLMLELGIAEAELEEVGNEEITQIDILDDKKKTVSYWSLILASGVAKGNSCNAMKVLNPWGRQALHVFGAEADVATVRYLFSWLCKEIDRLCKLWAAEQFFMTPGRSERDSFRVGAAQAISQRIIAERAQVVKEARSNGQERGLVRIDARESQIQEHLENLGVKTRSWNRSTSVDASAYADGVRAGKSINLDGERHALGGPKKTLPGQ